MNAEIFYLCFIKSLRRTVSCFCVLLLLATCIGSYAAVSKLLPPLSDAEVKRAVEDELTTAGEVAMYLVDIEVDDGVVELNGIVPDLQAKDRAIRLAETVRAVRAVIDRLQVQPAERKDKQILEDVRQALRTNVATDAYETDAAVNNGVVMLQGFVQSKAEKKLVEDVVKNVRGVRRIVNDIEVAARDDRSDTEIAMELRQLLKADPYVDAENVEVEVKDRTILLSGEVSSIAAKSRAVAAGELVNAGEIESEELVVKFGALKTGLVFEIGSLGPEQIEEAVEDALSYDPRVDVDEIGVSFEDGTIALAGIVRSLQAKRAAEQDAASVSGVRSVANQLRVRPVDPPDDATIERNVRESLARSLVWPDEGLTVLVRNQKVYLYGTVETHYDKLLAEDIAAGVQGVVKIQNNLQTSAKWGQKSDDEIAESVRGQLFWSPFVDSSEIIVSVADGVVELTGTVQSWYGSKAAVENAFQGGAKTVVNHLTIKGEQQEQRFERYEYPFVIP